MLFDKEKKSNREVIYKDSEAACLDDIKLMATDKEFKVSYKYRLLRNPIIGDKFSSRHGQKGVLSILWPQEDMPFTDQGITPDVIINPHAFPSRMTIGMLIESMAGKAGALEGKFQESAAFQNFDKLEEFGSRLIRLGFNYFGSEKMYSGIFGNEMTADIYLGVVYYQRLRHMVADKFQARSTGPVDILTNQPVKGRKKHGGIRLGEMERDSLLGHGGAFMLYDRLFKCSDESSGFLCESCGSILTAFMKVKGENAICSLCGTEAQKVSLPFVLRYLTNELAAMGIKLKFKAA
jgi:DNA-directed RNA polymerase I subunit RPA2